MASPWASQRRRVPPGTLCGGGAGHGGRLQRNRTLIERAVRRCRMGRYWAYLIAARSTPVVCSGRLTERAGSGSDVPKPPFSWQPAGLACADFRLVPRWSPRPLVPRWSPRLLVPRWSPAPRWSPRLGLSSAAGCLGAVSSAAGASVVSSAAGASVVSSAASASVVSSADSAGSSLSVVTSLTSSLLANGCRWLEPRRSQRLGHARESTGSSATGCHAAADKSAAVHDGALLSGRPDADGRRRLTAGPAEPTRPKAPIRGASVPAAREPDPRDKQPQPDFLDEPSLSRASAHRPRYRRSRVVGRNYLKLTRSAARHAHCLLDDRVLLSRGVGARSWPTQETTTSSLWHSQCYPHRLGARPLRVLARTGRAGSAHDAFGHSAPSAAEPFGFQRCSTPVRTRHRPFHVGLLTSSCACDYSNPRGSPS